MGPTLALRAIGRGQCHIARAAQEFWQNRSTGGVGSDARYRWELTHERAGGAEYVPALESWEFRPSDAPLIERQGVEFGDKLLLPLIVADACELLLKKEFEQSWFEEAAPAFRRDIARYLHGQAATSDLLMLFALSLRPNALSAFKPFALAISSYFVPTAKREGIVHGLRYPYHETPLLSASAMLAEGLFACETETPLLARLLRSIADQEKEEGFCDVDNPPDPFTNFLAARLLSKLDPAFDPERSIAHLARWQEAKGFWRFLGPETPWFTWEITKWLASAGKPFATRFEFPPIEEMRRDQKTKLPYYAYFVDVATLMRATPGLSEASVEVAFLDLAGFREFNNTYGQDAGDDVLCAFAETLSELENAVVIRDGGDEFLVIGAPTGTGLRQAMVDFRERWPKRFVERFGADVPPVVSRAIMGTCRGATLRSAREILGRHVGQLKHRERELGRIGLLEDLGELSSF